MGSRNLVLKDRAKRVKYTKKDIDISGTHVVVEYDSTDLPPVRYVDINSLPESLNKKLSSTDVTTQQV